MALKSELLDDISQVSDLSIKSLFKNRTPDWKKKRDEFIDPFYPNPKTADIVQLRSTGLGKYTSKFNISTIENTKSKFNNFVESNPNAYYKYKEGKDEIVVVKK